MKKAFATEIKQFGTRVKQLREERNLTQQALAGLADMDIRTIQRIEKGENAAGLQVLFAIAEGLNVEVLELFKPSKSTPR